MLRTILARLKNSRLIASLVGLVTCSAALMLAVRLVRQIVQIVGAGGAAQLGPVWPRLALLGLFAGFAAMAGFAVLVYGTGGLTPWHEAIGTAADSQRRNGSPAPFPDAMDPGQRMGPGVVQPSMRLNSVDTTAAVSAEADIAEHAGHSEPTAGDSPAAADAVPASAVASGEGSAAASDGIPEGHVRCAACGAVNSDMVPFCALCGEDIVLS